MAQKSKQMKPTHEGDGKYHLKYKICVSGAAETGHCAPDALEKAEAVGRAVAKMGMVLVTGATTGVPYWAAKGAKEAGGIVVGISPASSNQAHVKSYRLPTDYHDVIIYTGFEYAGRNLLLVRASDATITVCGRMGTLNEFTIGYEDKKPLGVLTETGGTADMLKDITANIHKPHKDIVYDPDPETLVRKVSEMVAANYKKANGKRDHSE
jgi:uncharacterized protein (TIGR00725 family)